MELVYTNLKFVWLLLQFLSLKLFLGPSEVCPQEGCMKWLTVLHPFTFHTLSDRTFMHIFHQYDFIIQSTTSAEGAVRLYKYLKNSTKIGCLDVPSR